MSKPLETNTERSFTFGETEWSNYMKFRPEYPSALIKLMKSYHENASNKFDIAHDVASGCGVFVPFLARDFGFKHIHMSDPGVKNIQSAQSYLSSWFASRDENASPSRKTTVTISRTTGEEMHTCAPSHSVDLVTIMEGVHWMDAPRMMASAAKTLSPGGTIAAVTYCAAPHIKHSVRASIAFKKAVGMLWAHNLQSKKDANEPGAFELERGLQQGCVGHDYLPIQEDIWRNVRRIRIRSKEYSEYPFNMPYSEQYHFASSNTNPNKVYECYKEGDDEAQGWNIKVDYEWFYGYLTSMEDPLYVANMKEFKELMEILKEEFPGGNIPVEWTVDVVLATRC